jgi:glycosyltransferase involved in cell wall biosynthesis
MERIDYMVPPFLSYVTFNRMGLTARNLKSILDTPEDFEMHIIDSNSKDGTWDYLQTLTDSRIKSKTRLTVNSGPIFALNLNLTKRRPEQYFFSIDSDVFMKTPDWLTRFMRVFNTFPDVGLLGVQRTPPYLPVYPAVVPKSSNGVSYLELTNGFIDVPLDFVHGCCMGMRPELIPLVGYWSEETCYGDAELTPRVMHYTPFKAGYMTDPNMIPQIDIDMTQRISCAECPVQGYCKLDKVITTCFNIHSNYHKNEPFVNLYKWKYLEFFRELQAGQRTAYCASIYDGISIASHSYNSAWAMENMNYYIQNSN